MAYATYTDVASEFKDVTFSASTAITDTEVTEFIVQAEAYINSYISTRYEVPVSGSVSVLILKTVVILLVKARILSILSVKTPQDKTKQDPDGPSLIEQAKKMLEMIKKGTLPLTDATVNSTGIALTSFLKDEDIDYSFTMESDAW